MVDAFKVVGYSTLVSPAVLDLNDTEHFQGTQSVQITNSGDESVTYHFSHEAGITALTKSAGTAWVSVSPPYVSGDGNTATVEISPADLTLGPGESGSVSISFTEPSSPDAATLPVYGGSIVVAGSQGEAVRVSYMGESVTFQNPHPFQLTRLQELRDLCIPVIFGRWNEAFPCYSVDMAVSWRRATTTHLRRVAMSRSRTSTFFGQLKKSASM